LFTLNFKLIKSILMVKMLFISNFRFNNILNINIDFISLKFNVNNGIPLQKLMNVP